MYVISVLLSMIFLLLGIIHLNWAIGNTWGLDKALPTDDNGNIILQPSTAITLVVALGLMAFAAFYFINPQPGNQKNWIFEWGRLIIPAIFILRAIGDFKYVGLFKKIKQTTFGKMDSKFYTPLCILIGAIGLMIRFV